MAIVALVAFATAFVLRRESVGRSPGDRTAITVPTPASLDCRAVWQRGVELAGKVGERDSQAYFDKARVRGKPDQVSGIVLFPGERGHQPLADTPIGLEGPGDADGCGVRLRESGGSIWRLRVDSASRVAGTHTAADGRVEAITFDVVPERKCDGAGEWRTFSSPKWPIAFDYPADWVLTDDEDDVNVECPSVTRLASGGSWLTFERGRLPSGGADASPAIQSAFDQPYWFVRIGNDDWRVNDQVCAGREVQPAAHVRCAPARRSVQNGVTVLQGAAGDHRLYRAGVGYLGEGRGITRYLFVLGDRWVSLDSAAASAHSDDIGQNGGVVLLDGDAVGDRLVRSIRPR